MREKVADECFLRHVVSKSAFNNKKYIYPQRYTPETVVEWLWGEMGLEASVFSLGPGLEMQG